MKSTDKIRSKKRKKHEDDRRDIPKDKLDTKMGPTWQISTKQMKTVHRIYKEPTPNDIRWSNVVSLFRHLKFTLEQGMGSRIKFKGAAGVFGCHSPHPSKQVPPEDIRDIRNFLQKIGVTP